MKFSYPEAKQINNIWIAMVRGNHDDPAYFQNQLINKTRWHTIPDYSIIEACNHNVLCIGEAISIDRQWRLQAMAKAPGKQYYWQDDHQSWHSEIDGIMFTMLDIMELQEIYP